MRLPVVILGGPTASGKNRIAREIGEEFQSEIVNADSRQIYRDLKIGTNQPSDEEYRSIPNHLYGFLDPSQAFSAADFERAAFPLVQQILQRKRLPIIVGGTGFYIKALLKGVWSTPPPNEPLRNKLRKIRTKKGSDFLYRMLQRIDPMDANQLSLNDAYRIMRSLEIYFSTGVRRSEWASQKEDRFTAYKFYLNPDRTQLVQQIRLRTEQMFASGWVEEVEVLLQKYPAFETMPASLSLGYREIIRFLKGEMDLTSCREMIILKTTQYAKKQLTWFRNQDRFVPLPPREDLHNLLKSVIQ